MPSAYPCPSANPVSCIPRMPSQLATTKKNDYSEQTTRTSLNGVTPTRRLHTFCPNLHGYNAIDTRLPCGNAVCPSTAVNCGHPDRVQVLRRHTWASIACGDHSAPRRHGGRHTTDAWHWRGQDYDSTQYRRHSGQYPNRASTSSATRGREPRPITHRRGTPVGVSIPKLLLGAQNTVDSGLASRSARADNRYALRVTLPTHYSSPRTKCNSCCIGNASPNTN